ncbi:MAG: Rho termination factor N-terminal domain-containing protein [Pseudomonadota bacterium]|nr:Rho termination factor N-terminal domain-containing protein [Pseudomonadota bacterium]
MSKTAEKTDPKLWEKVKDEVEAGDKGGKPGQWSARKAQLAVHDYKEEGGGYKGEKTADNHLSQWTKEEWGTKSGEKSENTGERYLPKKACEKMDSAEYKETSDKKRADTAKGKQHSKQPEHAAATTKEARLEALPVAELRRKAATAKIEGRSKMTKADLVKALERA